jgi:hypothetical protein
MFGRTFVWLPVWALLEPYSPTKFDGPGKWLCFKTVYWEMHDGKKIYYAEEVA